MADSVDNRILELHPGAPAPVQLAVDHANDLFVAGFPSVGLTDFLAEVPNGAAPSAAIGLPVLSSPTAMASDGAGDIFLINQNANLVQELPLLQQPHPVIIPTTVATTVPTTVAAASITTTTTGPSLPVTGDNSDLPLPRRVPCGSRTRCVQPAAPEQRHRLSTTTV